VAKAKQSLVDDVLSRVASNRPGFRTWFERLPPEVQQELEVVRQNFDPSIHQKNAFADAVIAVATERGWEISGKSAVIAWLKAKKQQRIA
jgi:hypothetical protein